MQPMPSLSINEEVQLMVHELRQYFSPVQLEELAGQAGFIQRKGKLAAHDFVSLCSFSNQDLSTDSLTSLCSQLRGSIANRIKIQ